MRLAFAAVSSAVEAKFYRTVTEEVSPHVGRYILVALFFSAGMFNAATSFLPSTFAMWTTFLAYSFILRQPSQVSSKRTYRAVTCLGLGAMLGWPFSAIVGLPFMAEELLVYGRDVGMDAQGNMVQLLKPKTWQIQRATRLARAVVTCGAAIAVSRIHPFLPCISSDVCLGPYCPDRLLLLSPSDVCASQHCHV